MSKTLVESLDYNDNKSIYSCLIEKQTMQLKIELKNSHQSVNVNRHENFELCIQYESFVKKVSIFSKILVFLNQITILKTKIIEAYKRNDNIIIVSYLGVTLIAEITLQILDS